MMLTDSYLYSAKGSFPHLLPATFLLYPHLSFPLCMDKGHKWVLVCVPLLGRTPCKSLGFGPLLYDLTVVVQLLVQFSSVARSCLTLCDPMNHSTPGLPVHHQLPESTQTHVHRVGDAIQPSHPLSSPSPPAPNPSQHQGLFQRANSLHEVAKVLEFQLQHQSFQWTPRTDLL